MKSGEIIRASHDRNREWILLLATVCVVAMKIPYILIYQRELGDLKDG